MILAQVKIISYSSSQYNKTTLCHIIGAPRLSVIMSTETSSFTTISPTPNKKHNPYSYLSIIAVIIVTLLIIAGFVVLVLLYRKKSRNKYSLGKIEPARHCSNTERSAEAVHISPQHVYSTIRNEDRICGDNEKDTECIYAAVKEVNNPKKQDFSQVYDEINFELVERRQNRSTTQTGRMIEVECSDELHSVVGTSNKNEMQHGSENTANTLEHQNVFEVYAEISKDYITASQEFQEEVNEYAVVDNTKIMYQEQNNDIHMSEANKSLENNRVSVEPDSSHIYSMVDKNRTYSTSSGSVGSST